MSSQLFSQEPFIGLQIVLQQIRAVVRAAHFEIVGPGPFGPAFDLIPAVEHFSHLDGLPFPNEPSRRLVGFGPGVTFDLDRDESCHNLGPKHTRSGGTKTASAV